MAAISGSTSDCRPVTIAVKGLQSHASGTVILNTLPESSAGEKTSFYILLRHELQQPGCHI